MDPDQKNSLFYRCTDCKMAAKDQSKIASMQRVDPGAALITIAADTGL